jgi:ubiquinone/menaquinone biosynthesis C-methylase UbiE
MGTIVAREPKNENVHRATVEGFGAEWAAFDQSKLRGAEYEAFFDAYFGILPANSLTKKSEGFDLGCGSGRWAARVAKKVGLLHCIDPSPEALAVAERRLAGRNNVRFHCAAADSIPLEDGSQDFGYSLGVLHHIPDTRAALADCARKLKPGAPFLVYLYYALEGRPAWFRLLWAATDQARRLISRLPFRARRTVTDCLAAGIYWPLARAGKLAERLGADVSNIPLAAYRQASFYTMRTDALDRFGTRLEQRFTRVQIEAMMRDAGLTDIRFSDREPYWVACGRKQAPA